METNILVQLSEIVPSPNSIIGYVTTGHYSLARGVGFAIGAISLVQLIELEQQSIRLVFAQNIHIFFFIYTFYLGCIQTRNLIPECLQVCGTLIVIIVELYILKSYWMLERRLGDQCKVDIRLHMT